MDRRAALGVLGGALICPLAVHAAPERQAWRVGGMPLMPDGDLLIHIITERLRTLGLNPSIRQESTTLRVEIDASEGLAVEDAMTRPGAFTIHRDVHRADSCENPPEDNLCLPAALPDAAFFLVARDPVVSAGTVRAAKTFEGALGPGINIQLNNKAAKSLGEATTANVGKPLAVAVDGLVVMAPIVRTPILGGDITIEGEIGDPTVLAAILSHPPMPHALQMIGRE